MKTMLLLGLMAVVSGALIPVQAASNAALSRVINGNVPFAAMTLFVVAALATALAVAALGEGHAARGRRADHRRRVPRAAALGGCS